MVTLLGDAAHAMTPNLGQGACQAIEDAYVLRAARANAVVVTARRLGAIGQWQNPLACWLRDGLFGLMPASLTLRQMRDA